MKRQPDVWLSKSMTQRGSAIHQMMTATDTEEETAKAVQAIDKATSSITPGGGSECNWKKPVAHKAEVGETKTKHG